MQNYPKQVYPETGKSVASSGSDHDQDYSLRDLATPAFRVSTSLKQAALASHC